MKSNKKAKKKLIASEKKIWLGNCAIKKTVKLRFILASEPIHSSKKLNKVANHKLRHYSLGTLTSIFILISIWLFAAFLFSSYRVNGENVKTIKGNQTLEKALNQEISAYKLKIIYPDKTEKNYSMAQIGLTLDTEQTLRSYNQAKNSLSSKLQWWTPIKSMLVFNQNQSQFNNFIATSTQIIVSPAKNASLTINNGSVQVSSGVAGTEYGLSSSKKTIYNYVANLDSTPIKLTKININPVVNAADLSTTKDKLDKIINQTISININGTVYSPNPSQIASWIVLNNTATKYSFAVNNAAVTAYINSIAGKYVRPPKAQVNNSSDNQILIAGQNGKSVSGQTTAVSTINTQLLNASGLSFTLTVSDKPYTTISAADYPKWIEVDLTNKRLYAYENSSLVQTYLVSAGAPRTPTVTGQYNIYSKFVTQNMRGENVDGSSYYQPNVPWINYFYRDYAIHGNYWRPTSYFGNINSSHGCVGLMVSQAAWVYNWAPIGTPVIIHY